MEDRSNGASDSSGSNQNISIDYLGQPPSPLTSSSESGQSDSIDFLGQPPSPITSSSESNAQSQERRERKQANPRKRKDRVVEEIVRYQKTTNLLIPKLPFQR